MTCGLTQNYLKELLYYNQITGVFTWKARPKQRPQWNARYAGAKAGSLDTNGYLRITINGSRYSAHRLAWFYVNGVWPENEIDHIDRDKTNNRISNLRDVDKSENQQNKIAAQRNSRTGFLGVHYCRKRENFVAKIMINKKRFHIGYFKTAEEASQAYMRHKIMAHNSNDAARKEQA